MPHSPLPDALQNLILEYINQAEADPQPQPNRPLISFNEHFQEVNGRVSQSSQRLRRHPETQQLISLQLSVASLSILGVKNAAILIKNTIKNREETKNWEFARFFIDPERRPKVDLTKSNSPSPSSL